MCINKYLFLLLFVPLFSCFGVKQIHGYKKIKKEIHSVSNVTIVNLLEIIDDKNKPPSSWERIPSRDGIGIVETTVLKYTKRYSKKKFQIKPIQFQSDSATNANILTLFNKLDSVKSIDEYVIDTSLSNLFSSVSDRYILLGDYKRFGTKKHNF
jgi:hypothetical protein